MNFHNIKSYFVIGISEQSGLLAAGGENQDYLEIENWPNFCSRVGFINSQLCVVLQSEA